MRSFGLKQQHREGMPDTEAGTDELYNPCKQARCIRGKCFWEQQITDPSRSEGTVGFGRLQTCMRVHTRRTMQTPVAPTEDCMLGGCHSCSTRRNSTGIRRKESGACHRLSSHSAPRTGLVQPIRPQLVEDDGDRHGGGVRGGFQGGDAPAPSYGLPGTGGATGHHAVVVASKPGQQ